MLHGKKYQIFFLDETNWKVIDNKFVIFRTKLYSYKIEGKVYKGNRYEKSCRETPYDIQRSQILSVWEYITEEEEVFKRLSAQKEKIVSNKTLKTKTFKTKI